jgi:hypothetical protein
MYESSSTLSDPADSLQPLWRYLSADRLSDLLKTQELFFAHLPVLEDAREGALTARSREHLARWFQAHNSSSAAQAYAEVDKYEEAHREFYVNCWHMNRHESYLMWKAYGGRGFAVETSFERLRASLENTTAAVTGGVVQYVDFERDRTPVGNVFTHVATKDKPYQDEREFRLVLWAVDPRNSDYPKATNGVRVKVDTQMLIRKVVQNPFGGPASPELQRLLDENGLCCGASSVWVRPRP